MKMPIKTRILLGSVTLVMLAGSLPSSSALPPGESDPIVTIPIITFHGAALAEHKIDGVTALVDAGSLEGTKDLGSGEVNLLFKGALGTVACGDGSGFAIILGFPDEGDCSADITANNLDCRAGFRFEGTQIEYSWGDGIGVCTVSEV